MSSDEASVGASDYSSSDFNDDGDSPVAKKAKKTPTSSGKATAAVVGTSKKKDTVAAAKATKETKAAATTSKVSTTAKAPLKPAPSTANNSVVSSSSSSAATSAAPSASSSAATTAAANGSGASMDITQGPPVASESAARKLIMQYMKQQNRPYSAIQVFENLHQRISKPMVQRLLDDLATPAADPEAATTTSSSSSSEDALRCKEYGKAKIYFIDQSKLQSRFSEAEVADVAAQVDAKEAELAVTQASCARLQAEANSLVSEPADADLDRVINETRRRLAEKQTKLSSVKGAVVDENARLAGIEEFNFYRNAWRVRKDKCIGAIDMIADGMEKPRAAVIALVGIETDEDAGVTGGCPPAMALPKPATASSKQ